MEKLIKNVDRSTWEDFKTEAMLHKMHLARFLSHLVKEHKRIEKAKTDAWDYILNAKPSITSKDADAIKASLKTFEKEYGFEQ